MKVDNRMLKEKQLAGGKGGDHEERDDRTRYWETWGKNRSGGTEDKVEKKEQLEKKQEKHGKYIGRARGWDQQDKKLKDQRAKMRRRLKRN